MRMWLEPQGSRPRKEGGTTLQRIRPPAAATAAVDLPASMSEVVVEVEEVVEVAKAVEAVEVAKAVEVVEAEVVVEVIVEVAEAVGVAVEVAPAAAVVEGPAAATGWPAAAVDVPAAGSCGGTCSPPGGWLSPLSPCCGTCCGAPQPTHALALGASSHGSCALPSPLGVKCSVMACSPSGAKLASPRPTYLLVIKGLGEGQGQGWGQGQVRVGVMA